MRRIFSFNMPTLLLSLVGQILGSLLLWLPYLPIADQVHAATSITPTPGAGSLGTAVTQGGNVYGITGGKTVGTNLFHSFGQFSIATGDTAQFQTSNLIPNATMSNILGRVTGGNPSAIFGTIDSATYYPSANLFLMNPAGFLFGPNATINVGGMMHATTADYLKLADGNLFKATPDVAADALLTSAPVAAFGFLGSNPAAIAIQGSTLQVAQGQSLSLVGGNQGFTATDPDTGNPIPVPGGITIKGGQLLAPGGQINIASVASPGEVVAGTMDYAPNVNGQSFGALGSINISEQSAIDVSGNGGGTVLIRGGQFVLDNSTILAQVTGPGPVTNGVEAIGGGVDIQVSGDAAIQNFAVIDTSVTGNATPGVTYGGTHVKADSVQVVDAEILSTVSFGSTGGNTGNITLEGNSILVKDSGTFFQILQADTNGAGNSGNITLTSQGDLLSDNAFITTFSSASGSAGNISLTSMQGNISMVDTSHTAGSFISSQVCSSGPCLSTGTVGNITVNAPAGDILMTDVATLFTQIRGIGNNEGRGGIQVTAHNLTMQTSAITIDNFSASQSGNLTLNLTGRLSISSMDPNIPGLLSTTTRGAAQAAALNITAHDIALTGNAQVTSKTVVTANPGSGTGNGGPINISTQTLELTQGAQIISGAVRGRQGIPSGSGGTVTIHGLSGPADSVLIDSAGSGFFTPIQSPGVGSGIFTDTQGTGAGGNISVNANSVALRNGAHVSSSSTGTGIAGDITITAGNQFAMTNSTVTTEANQSSGGKITITTNPTGTVQLTDSLISASVLDGTGGGGSVNIDPQYVLLQNSQILANAVFGPGGNIFITTNLLLPDAISVISASSQFGQQGTITIQSPIAPASRIIQLSQKPLIATSLLTQRCAALAGGEMSSFTVAGRDSLPAEPGGWLSSPLALAISETGGGTLTGSGTRVSQSEPAGETTSLLSLRRIAPPGFLTQAFAVDWSAGCTS